MPEMAPKPAGSPASGPASAMASGTAASSEVPGASGVAPRSSPQAARRASKHAGRTIPAWYGNVLSCASARLFGEPMTRSHDDQGAVGEATRPDVPLPAPDEGDATDPERQARAPKNNGGGPDVAALRSA